MSGQLVGEVIAAADRLRQQGLPERGFHALVAIAEKCHTQTREGSVRWDHIRSGLYGASLSTAKRAVADLKTAGVVRVLRRGFDNHAGKSHAPIYRIEPLGERVTQVTHSPSEPTGHLGDTFALPERVTQVTHSLEGERVTQVTHLLEGERVKSGGRTGQIGGPTGHPGDLLDGSIDGPIDGGGRKSSSTTTTPPPKILEEEEPPRDCLRHPGGTRDRCGDCADTRRAHQRWHAERGKREHQAAADRRHAIDICGLCNEVGQRLAANGLDAETPTRCDHTAEAAR